ncbi:hypothetical protein KSS87_010451 [Heliosperma pusillum]|nr:hypothetical protein KSS87_010451 [Heliosperma pusillum]
MSFSRGKEIGEFQRENLVEEEKMYVAVSKEVKENNSMLTWALQNSGGKKVCIIHVHQPAKRIPTPIGYMLASASGEKEVKTFRDQERQEMLAVLDEYLRISQKSGVSIEKLYIEVDSIEKGIIQLVEEHNIENLVIGSAADRHYSRKMMEVRSRKAVYVRDHAPPSCHIWFVCNGYLIYTRKGIKPIDSSPVENAPVIIERDAGGISPTAPPRWSTDSIDNSASRSGSPHAFDGARRSLSLHPYLMTQNDSASSKAVETELANVKAELEWMKANVGEVPKKADELETKSHVAELEKVKAELESVKNGVLGMLRSAVEQKTMLENQTRNSAFLLQMLGEKLASAINVVDKHDEL